MAILLNPQSSKAYNALGWWYFESSQLAMAAMNFIKALKLDMAEPEYYKNVGLMYSYFLLTDTARKYRYKALELQPDYTQAIDEFLVEYRCLQQYDSVLKYARIIYDLNTFDEWNIMRLAEAYSYLGNYREAEKYFRILEKMIRDLAYHETSGSAPFRHRLGYVLWQLGKKQEAMQLFKEEN